MSTYVLLHPKNMALALEALGVLVIRFAKGEAGAEEVLCDALVEHAVWSGASWKDAQKQRDKHRSCNLFWIGGGMIRQNVIRAARKQRFDTRTQRIVRGAPTRRGWKEIDATAKARREERAHVDARKKRR